MKKTLAITKIICSLPIAILGFIWAFILDAFSGGIQVQDDLHDWIDKGL